MLTQDYTTIVSNLLAGKRNYTPNYLYVEFTNSDIPAITEDTQGREYYDGLTDIGYLRVPITIKPTVLGTKITYTVLLSSTTSANGVPFGNSSKIYGVALVSALNPENSDTDIVFAREYFTDKYLEMVEGQTFCFSFQISVFDGATPTESLDWNEEE